MIDARCLTVLVLTLLLGACGDAPGPSAGKSPDELEQELVRTTSSLSQARAAHEAAQRESTALRAEVDRNRQRLAGLSAEVGRLEQGNGNLARDLARARDQLARGARFNKTLREQRDRDLRHIRALTADAQTLRGNLARAHAEIRRLQADQGGNPRRSVEMRRRDAAMTREIEELRRYNGYLLQERGNLQAWLQDADAARRKQEGTLERVEQEKEQTRTELSAAESANADLRRSLDEAREEMATLVTARDALEIELDKVRAETERWAAAQRERTDALEEALARANAPAEAVGPGREIPKAREDHDDAVGALRAEVEAAHARIARLRAAKDYLMEKIEACALQEKARARALDRITRAPLTESGAGRRLDFGPQSRTAGRLVHTRWQPGGIRTHGERTSPLMPVANETGEPAKSARHEKELEQTRQKLKDLEEAHGALQGKLAEVETELATVKKQVETLTWANKELVKELDAAYAAGNAASGGALPEGTRGIYVVRQGQSLSEVAKAFYGDSGRWPDIVAANKDKIPDPDRIDAGTVILIPE